MSLDALFDQPDIDPDIETRDDWNPAPVFRATATRTGRTWAVTIPELPGGLTGHARGRTWGEAQDNAFACVADLLGDDAPPVYGVSLAPADPDARAAIDAVVDARITLAYAEQAVRDAVRHAARTLTDQGWNNRDAGKALRLSHQRISQLAPRTAP